MVIPSDPKIIETNEISPFIRLTRAKSSRVSERPRYALNKKLKILATAFEKMNSPPDRCFFDSSTLNLLIMTLGKDMPCQKDLLTIVSDTSSLLFICNPCMVFGQ